MTTILNDTIHTAKTAYGSMRDGAEEAVDAAKHAVETGKERGDQVASTVRSTFLDRVNGISGIIATLRNLGADDALGWVGLSRRRGPLASFGIFSAGFASGALLGAGAGLIFAPTSGATLRRRIARSVENFGRDGDKVMHETEAKVAEVMHPKSATDPSVEGPTPKRQDAADHKGTAVVDGHSTNHRA